jgi:hypothetical protein
MQIAQFDVASGSLDVLHVRSLSKWLWNPQILALDVYSCLKHPPEGRSGLSALAAERVAESE